MVTHDLIVIGAGLFGSIIAQAARKAELDVVVIDDRRPNSGSFPAACLMKNSWFSSLGEDVYVPALKTLRKLYTVREIRLRTGIMNLKVFWIDPKHILQEPTVVATVSNITRYRKFWEVTTPEVDCYRANKIVVAAGIWTQELLPKVQQRGLAGIAFLWPKIEIERPYIKPWAPYRQLVVFNRGDGAWVSDGTAVSQDKWSIDVENQSLARCSAAKGVKGKPVRLFGIRPYSDAKPCLFEELDDGLWVASGGAKNGTLAAGWCAHQLMGVIK